MSALQETPYPATLEEAIEEIKTQRNLVVRANQNWMKCAERRELDARANKGMLKAAQQENKDLREEQLWWLR